MRESNCKRQSNYEELTKKKLKEFYTIVQVVSVEIALGEGTILEKSKIYIMYGIDIVRRKNDNRLI